MTNKTIHQPSDKLFKLSMSKIAVAKEFFTNHLPAEILKKVDLSSLKLEKDTFVDNTYQTKESDVLYSVKMEDKPAYLHLLCEHQSDVDKLIALRLLIYKLRIMELHTNQHPNSCLPPIYSMVIYTGKAHWTAELDFYALFGEEETFARKILFEPYQLIDVHRVSDDALYREELFGLVAFVYKHHKTKEFAKFLKKLIPWLNQIDVRHECGSILGGNLLTYVAQFSSEKNKNLLLEESRYLSPKLKGKVMTIAESWKQEGFDKAMTIAKSWKQEGFDKAMTIAKNWKQEGRQEGRQEGEAIMLKRQLMWRFGNISPKHLLRIDNADSETLLCWGKRILDATTLEEVFA